MKDIHYLDQAGPDVKMLRVLIAPSQEHPDPFYILQVNVPRRIICYSPGGFNNKDHGGMDLALNILQHFCPGEEVELHGGARCSKAAAHLHFAFYKDFIISLDFEGGVFTAESIRAWLAASLEFNSTMLKDPVPPGNPQASPQIMVTYQNPLEDLKRLHFLTSEVLYMTRMRIRPGQIFPGQDPQKTMASLQELDMHLVRMEGAYSLTPGHMHGKVAG